MNATGVNIPYDPFLIMSSYSGRPQNHWLWNGDFWNRLEKHTRTHIPHKNPRVLGAFASFFGTFYSGQTLQPVLYRLYPTVCPLMWRLVEIPDCWDMPHTLCQSCLDNFTVQKVIKESVTFPWYPGRFWHLATHWDGYAATVHPSHHKFNSRKKQAWSSEFEVVFVP